MDKQTSNQGTTKSTDNKTGTHETDLEKTLTEFAQAMSDNGCGGATEIVPDGKLHRFTIDGDKPRSNAGWYVLHCEDYPAGAYGSWKSGEKFKWFKQINRNLSASEREAINKKINEQNKKREAEQAILYADARLKAADLWNRATESNGHGYLERKGILPHKTKQLNGHLLIPIYNIAGELTSLQSIENEIGGSKRFLFGGEIEGCFFRIGNPESDVVYICEGFATGASLYQSLESTVIVAFMTSNLLPVARAIRQKMPTAKIVFCADNDQYTERPVKNPGVHYATKAAGEVGGYVVWPEFDEHGVASKHTDFNDLCHSKGTAFVAGQIAEQLKREPILPELPVAVATDGANSDGTTHLSSGIFPHIVTDWPYMNSKGKPTVVIENVRHLMEKCGIHARYDVIKKSIDIQIPNETFLIDTAKNSKMTRIISVATNVGMNPGRVPEFVDFIAAANPYNPVATWIMSKPWDGVERLQAFFDTVYCKDQREGDNKLFKETLMRKWMLSAVAAAFEPNGVSAHGILVFQGDQYVGKTKWFKSLAPSEMNVIADGMILDPKDKDSVYQVVTNWLVELGELDATFRKSDIAQLKSFVTKQQDTLRRPYAREESEFARRTVFFGSVNPEDYLNDPTGNRRFWTIAVQDLNHSHCIDMQQVWAEFYGLYKSGESWYLNETEMKRLNEHNKDFESTNMFEELIKNYFDFDQPCDRQLKLVEICQAINLRNLDNRDSKQVAKALKSLKVEQIRTKKDRFYKMPNLISIDAPKPYRPWDKD